jgi:hypothetical protein
MSAWSALPSARGTTVLDRFTRERLETRVSDGTIRKTLCWRYRELAIHDKLGFWQVFHVPSGCSFFLFGVFDAVDDAASAAIALDRCRNDWTDIGEIDRDALRQQAIEVFAAHNARPAPAILMRVPPVPTIQNDLNGYGVSA